MSSLVLVASRALFVGCRSLAEYGFFPTRRRLFCTRHEVLLVLSRRCCRSCLKVHALRQSQNQRAAPANVAAVGRHKPTFASLLRCSFNQHPSKHETAVFYPSHTDTITTTIDSTHSAMLTPILNLERDI